MHKLVFHYVRTFELYPFDSQVSRVLRNCSPRANLTVSLVFGVLSLIELACKAAALRLSDKMHILYYCILFFNCNIPRPSRARRAGI